MIAHIRGAQRYAVRSFDETLRRMGQKPLLRSEVTTLQVNVGKLCNMACHHCHVDAGPKRREIMARGVASRVVELLEAHPAVTALDLTGGAPELNPNFRFLVSEAHRLGKDVIDRCNLTVFFEPELEDMPRFLADHRVRVVASLPCYTPGNVDEQRGRGAFERSIEALRRLNALGYGMPGSGLVLDLVYNPVGPSLPPPQAELERAYRDELLETFGICFNQLLTITNMPIKRFAHALERAGRHAEYMGLLVNHFNPATVPALMCRSLISVGWDGSVYDCDFNQMLEIPLGGDPKRTLDIWDIDSLADLEGKRIGTGPHCYGCTAGAGSSCGGALR